MSLLRLRLKMCSANGGPIASDTPPMWPTRPLALRYVRLPLAAIGVLLSLALGSFSVPFHLKQDAEIGWGSTLFLLG
jgi:hypothetical protein